MDQRLAVQGGGAGAVRATDAARSTGSARAASAAVPADVLDIEALLGNLHDCVVFQLMMEPSDDGEMHRRLTYVSPSIEPLFGVSVAEAMADPLNWYRLVEPERIAEVMRAEAEATRTLKRFSMEVPYRIDGVQRLFSITSTPTALEGGALRWDGVAMDITHRMETRQMRERLAAMIETGSVYAAIQTLDGECIYLNAAGRELRGLPDDVDLSTLSIEHRHPPEEARRMREEVLPYLLKNDIWVGNSVLLDTNGERIPVNARLLAHRGWDGRITHLSAVMRDLREPLAAEAKLRAANEQTEIALREVNHRVKNLFALVPALITLSARGKSNVGELVEAVQDRVMALARSHAMTLNAFSQDKGVALDALIRAVLEPYQGKSDAFRLDGPAVRLASSDGNAMALMLHELATNAAKYGALVAPKGTVEIVWRIAEGGADSGLETLVFSWSEKGGPPVEMPSTAGFGTRLIDRMILQQAGTVERDWNAQGVRVGVTLPIHPFASAQQRAAEPPMR